MYKRQEVYCGPAEVGAVSEGACVEVDTSVDWKARERDLTLYSMAGYNSKVAMESQSPGGSKRWKVDIDRNTWYQDRVRLLGPRLPKTNDLK